MIYLDIKGRLGNQLFQYAFARRVQLATNNELTVKFQENISFGTFGTDGWENSLAHFKTVSFTEIVGSKPLWMSYSSYRQRLVGYYALLKKRLFQKDNEIENNLKKQQSLLPLLKKNGLYWLYNGYYDFSPFDYSKNIFIKGTFEDPLYFKSIKKILQAEYEPKEDILPHNKELYERINSTNSVCVSVRSFKEIKGDQATSSLYNVCTPEYFQKAIHLLREKLDNPIFYIFSDDIEWTKSQIDLSNVSHVFETDNNPVWEKLRLMYSCKHYILSNSTFSWWAQYLSRNEQKLVISPSRWFNDGYESPLIDKSWITI